MELQFAKNISNLLILLFESPNKDIESFFSTVRFLLQAFAVILSTKWNHLRRISNTPHQNACDAQTFESPERLSIAEMNMMMSRLGAACKLEDINESASFRTQDLVSLFEEEEPSLDEIKDAFEVFDVNNDGFIDASELHRVVCSLGLREMHEFEECKKMVRAFDGDGDGLIDFQEFVKLMEKCLC